MARPNNGGVHKLTVKNKNPGSISTGANTQVELDGQPLKGVRFLKIECKPASVVKVTMELYAEVEVEADVALQHTAINPDEEIKIGDAIYVLGKYETAGVPEIKKKK